ncbi:MAG: hypothetical protein IH873_00540 [Chloroflexi bacterium]|nr:hypothetical protein [Chloroflexota bacterium]
MDRQRLAITLIAAVLALSTACGGEEQGLPTATPAAETKTVAPNLEPQTQALTLRIASPEINLVTGSDRVTVSGVTSPDATLSVNGLLALPDAQGRFSISLDRFQSENPLVIEVVATSITGESKSQVRPVIFSDGSGGSGVFGTVTSVTPSEITLQTGSGPVTLSLDAATTAGIHGWESPSVSNIAQGTLVAVMTDGSRAVSVLAVPGRPVRTRHFTGLVVASDTGGSLTLRDDSGWQVTATAIDGLDAAPVGELVTAVLEQDLSTGSLTVTAFDRALAGAERLYDALALNQDIDSPEASANMTALRWRLAEHGVRNLSMLVNGQPYEGRREAIASADEVYAKLFSKHRIGAPSADVTGLVTSIDSGTGQVTVQPTSGPAVMVRISDTTPVALFGERVRSGQLDLASRVTVRYALSGNDASRVAVMAGNTLPGDSSIQLAVSAGRGEVQGTLIDIGAKAAIITILDRATGKQISLQTAGTTVFRNGSPTNLDSVMAGTNVFARFDPGSYRLLELDIFEPLRSEELVSGVVHSFIPKVADGNLTIRTPDGQLRRFTHNADTLIRRDGLRVSINEVRLGDLVRPNTRVRPPDTAGGRAGEIVVLSLKAPEPGLVTGIIRGVSGGLDGPGGYARVTVSNIWFDLISLKVGTGTAITQQGRTLAVRELAVGQEVTYGSYDPVTLVAGQLVLDPPKVSARASVAGGK